MRTPRRKIPVKLLTTFLAVAIYGPLAQAADDGGRCYLRNFIKHIGYQGILNAESSLVSLDAALGDEARCTYQVRFAACIDKGMERLRAAIRLGKASSKAQRSIVMIEITKSIVERGIEISYNVEKAGFFSRPKFSKIELQERFFGLPLATNAEIFNERNLKGWRRLCELGNMSEARFMKEIEAGKDL